MKNTLIFFFAILLSLNINAQSFEGKVTYQVNFKTKEATTSNEDWGKMLGTSHEYYVKGADYYANMGGTLFEWQRYVSVTNKYYFKLGNSNKMYWSDAALNKTPGVFIAHNKAVTKVLGHICDELIYKTKTGTHTYYFSVDFPIDSKLFINHKYGDWYEYLSRSNALPLKEIVDSDDFLMEMVATEIIPSKLESSIFQLPEGLLVEKSPF